ncbi:hypothetical protein ACTXT7_016069 [Hymenolepis weldensis]
MLIYALMYTPNKEHIRHILLFEFHQGNTPSSSAGKTLKDTYANDVVNERPAEGGFLQRNEKTQRQSLKGWEIPPPPHPSHDLSEINKQQRATCCVSLRSRELRAPFLDPIITDSNEKWWILYNNVKHKTVTKSFSGSKPIPQPRQFGNAPEKILLFA